MIPRPVGHATGTAGGSFARPRTRPDLKGLHTGAMRMRRPGDHPGAGAPPSILRRAGVRLDDRAAGDAGQRMRVTLMMARVAPNAAIPI